MDKERIIARTRDLLLYELDIREHLKLQIEENETKIEIYSALLNFPEAPDSN